MKTCVQCGGPLPAGAYRTVKLCSDECRQERREALTKAASRRHYEANRVELIRRAVEYGRSSKGRAVRRAAAAKYLASEHGAAASSESQRRYRASEHGKASARNKSGRRRAAKRASGGEPFSATDLEAHLDALGRSCHWCGGPFEHLDHVIPLARGGRHELANLVPSCARCNLSKGAKLVEEWRP